MTSYLESAIDAARAAGDQLRRMWPKARQVQYKALRDIVTDADFAAQKTIADRLRARYPDHDFLGEEGGAEVALDGPTPLWIADPLDGTTNYSRNFPNFSVAVALAEAGSVRVGVIYDPLRRELFYAERGAGAFVQAGRARPQRLAVTTRAEFVEAVIGVDWARDPERRDATLYALVRIGAASRTVRSCGSAALGLAYVAAGRLEAYFHLALAPWDVAAGALLVQEAGGRVTTNDGSPWQLPEPAVVASNGAVHAELLSLLKGNSLPL